MGIFGIDLVRRDGAQRDERRHQQKNSDDEHGPRREKIANGAHHRGRQAVADRGETRVAAKPFADRRVADQTEADGGHGRAEHAASKRMQDRAGEHDGKDRQHRIGQRADADRDHGDAGDKTFGAGGVNHSAAGHLAEQ